MMTPRGTGLIISASMCMPYYDHRSLTGVVNVDCTNGNLLGSVCWFSCSDQRSTAQILETIEIKCTAIGWDKIPNVNCFSLLNFKTPVPGKIIVTISPS